MKKLLSILLALTIILSLVACGGHKPTGDEEKANREEQQIEQSREEEKKEEKKQDEEKNKPKEYDATAWVKDNTSISFYLMYNEQKPEINQHLTFKILDGKAVLYSKKGEDEERPITIYEETAEGIVTTQLLYIGDAKAAMVNLPKADQHDLTEYLPKTGNVLATFGARAEKDSYKDKEITGKTEYLGRKCDVIEKNSGVSTQTIYLDSESGIIMKNETVTKLNDTVTRAVSCYVTGLEYGEVTEDDVTVDLSDFKITYEEPEEENAENKEADAE